MKNQKEYIKTIKFGLTNYNRTYNKYQNYKVKDFENILTQECLETLSESQKQNIFRRIESKLYESRYNIDLIYKEDKGKKEIRELKTAVNYAGSLVMRDIVDEYSANENQKRIFSIKLYLYHYHIINEIMHEIITYLINE